MFTVQTISLGMGLGMKGFFQQESQNNEWYFCIYMFTSIFFLKKKTF